MLKRVSCSNLAEKLSKEIERDVGWKEEVE
jgi:hypothetical protein